jgi:tRNA pseudouridine38-40 synthase
MTLFFDAEGSSPSVEEERGEERLVNRLKLVVAYDGTDFHGFAAQDGVRTVAGTLTDALEKVLHFSRANLQLACAGRTDAGVHAWGQVVSVQAPDDIDPPQLRHALNHITGPEIVVRSCDVVDDSFDARHSAQWRRYRYTIVNRPDPDPFLARYAWWVDKPLDLARLRLAADPFVGEHDFAAFCRKGPPGSTTMRTVLDSHWIEDTGRGDDVLVYEVRAKAFCWQMVRSVVGTIVDAAIGRLRPGDIMQVLRAGDRQAAGRLAPAHGLCLWDVGYEE